LQVRSAQHASPLPPHGAHVPAEVPATYPLHTVPPSVQTPFAQQGSPLAPQLPHAPPVQVPLSGAGHVLAAAVHVAFPPGAAAGTQQPPLPHVSPAQQT
jgi:hypothetical protein